MTVSLKEIQAFDATNLVRWRNDNAQWFPKAEPLTVEGHLKWYCDSYLTDPSQNMYIVLLDGEAIGVVGMTIREGTGELERMILGNKTISRKGVMRQGMRQLMAAYGMEYYWLRVMPTNPVTISFHKRNDFRILTERGDEFTDVHGRTGRYVIMDRKGIPPKDWGKD